MSLKKLYSTQKEKVLAVGAILLVIAIGAGSIFLVPAIARNNKNRFDGLKRVSITTTEAETNLEFSILCNPTDFDFVFVSPSGESYGDTIKCDHIIERVDTDDASVFDIENAEAGEWALLYTDVEGKSIQISWKEF